MTNEEAIKILRDTPIDLRSTREDDIHTLYATAQNMAIDALLAEAEQVTGKLKNPCDSLLTADSEACKEQKSKLESASDTFCKSQLITCNRVKECNGVCPFEDALKHADKTQTMNEKHIINHDRDWIIGCIQHDGFIHTHRFDKENQIILEALSADAVEVVRCKDCKHYESDGGALMICTLTDMVMDCEWFCWFGERREP